MKDILLSGDRGTKPGLSRTIPPYLKMLHSLGGTGTRLRLPPSNFFSASGNFISNTFDSYSELYARRKREKSGLAKALGRPSNEGQEIGKREENQQEPKQSNTNLRRLSVAGKTPLRVRAPVGIFYYLQSWVSLQSACTYDSNASTHLLSMMVTRTENSHKCAPCPFLKRLSIFRV